MENHAALPLWKQPQGGDKKCMKTRNVCLLRGRLEDRWSKKNEITNLQVRLETDIRETKLFENIVQIISLP